MSTGEDLIPKKSVEIYMKIYKNLLTKTTNDAFKRSFKTRAQRAPLILKTRGLVPLLLFLASKSASDREGGKTRISAETIEYTSRKGGYQALLYAIVIFLKEEGMLPGRHITKDAFTLEQLSRTINEEEFWKNLAVSEELLQEFLFHFKNLAEALL